MTTTTVRPDYEHLSQSDVADVLGIDRTTVLRYQQKGMPYHAGKAGHEHSFRSVIAFYWHAWTQFKKGYGWDDLEPVKALAVACVHIEVMRPAGDEMLKHFVHATRGFFTKEAATRALYWAEGFVFARLKKNARTRR